MRGALQAAARTDWRPIQAQIGQGTPLGNLVTDAAIRRLETDSGGRAHARAGRPNGGRSPMDVDNSRCERGAPTGGEGVGATVPRRPPPDPVEDLSHAERSQREAFIDEVRRIRRIVASNSVTP
eukprot:3406874-Pyramimonas_sp.AAC.1